MKTGTPSPYMHMEMGVSRLVACKGEERKTMFLD